LLSKKKKFFLLIIIHYIGYFEDRVSSDSKPRTLHLDQGCIIPEIGICIMQKHEIAIFLIHLLAPDKAFGCSPCIPSNEEVVFVVHLIDYFDDSSADTYQNHKIEEKQLFKPVYSRAILHMFVVGGIVVQNFI